MADDEILTIREVAALLKVGDKGKGFATTLLDACMADAKRMKMKGVTRVASEKVWMPGRRILDKHGFECVDTAEGGRGDVEEVSSHGRQGRQEHYWNRCHRDPGVRRLQRTPCEGGGQ